jgi:hypothetical protein
MSIEGISNKLIDQYLSRRNAIAVCSQCLVNLRSTVYILNKWLTWRDIVNCKCIQVRVFVFVNLTGKQCKMGLSNHYNTGTYMIIRCVPFQCDILLLELPDCIILLNTKKYKMINDQSIRWRVSGISLLFAWFLFRDASAKDILVVNRIQ